MGILIRPTSYHMITDNNHPSLLRYSILMILALAIIVKVPAKPTRDKVDLLVVINSRSPLLVDYRTVGNTVRQVVLVGGLLDLGISGLRESSQSKKLRETVGEFDRFPILKAGIEGAFSLQAEYFEVAVSNDQSLLKKNGKPEVDKIQPLGHDYVLVLNEVFSGLITAWELSTLSASTNIEYQLVNLSSKNMLTKGAINGFANDKRDFDSAVSDRSAFVQDYTSAVGAALGTIFGQLSKNGHLTKMTTELGINFPPPLDYYLKDYAKKFDYEIKTPKGWNTVDMGTKYVTVLAPKKEDRQTFGLRFDVDLLIPELGQDLNDIDEYVALFNNKVVNLGYTVDQNTRPTIEIPSTSRLVVFDRPGLAGKEVVIFTQYGEDYVGIFSVVNLGEYETLMNKYQSLINKTFTSIEFDIK